MPKFTVLVQRVVTYTWEKTIAAKDEEAAQEKVEALLADEPERRITEANGWTLSDLNDSDEWTVESVDEE